MIAAAAVVVVAAALHPLLDPLNYHHYYCCSLPFDDSAFAVIVAVAAAVAVAEDPAPSCRPHQTLLVYMVDYLMMSYRPYFLNYPIARTAYSWVFEWHGEKEEKRTQMRQIIEYRMLYSSSPED